MKYITKEQLSALEEVGKKVEQFQEVMQDTLGFEFDTDLKRDFEYLLYGVQGGEPQVVEAVMRLTYNGEMMDFADGLLDDLQALGFTK
ncbi:hypothetical protein Goe27_02390 [Bacillus phage vB_BsuM-Goe27]|nr:hypothetical protein Goe27_02390 [Bacillus phage vB_BsuM-Goe27]